MRRVTESDIQKMRDNGYDRVTIKDAVEAFERSKMADHLIECIAKVFSGVTLGGGVGLQEAQGLDDYEDEATCAAYRETDEKEDWMKISSFDLNRCNSSLSFFDPEGMRFHLPAYMSVELRGEYDFGMSFCLTNLSDHGRSYFSVLSSSHRQVVREFLLFLLDDPDYEFDRSEIEQSLNTFWSEITTPDNEEE